MLDAIDKKAESNSLSDNEIHMKYYLKERIVHLLREEEIKWYERAKVKTLLQRDNNTRFFHLVANGKHRKQHIFRLEQEDGIIVVGDTNLKNNFSLVESRIEDIPQVSDEENIMLTSPFTEEEIKQAVFQMEHNKAPGPDGFPAEFYQVFWEIIKGDLMSLFKNFHEECLPLFSLNFGVITLLPKTSDAKQIQQYRLICLLNVSFKIFTKAGTNRLNRVAQQVVNPCQSAFMPGRNIM